jgi:hypothetical protein
MTGEERSTHTKRLERTTMSLPTANAPAMTFDIVVGTRVQNGISHDALANVWYHLL